MKDKNELAVDLFRGRLIRLCAVDPDSLSKSFVNWTRDTEYWRLLAATPPYPWSQEGVKKFIEKDLLKDDPRNIFFTIRALEDDRLIGELGFDGISYTQGETFVGIGIGERDYWDKGYGTDAMNVLLRYGFTELNLQRVTLTVFEYNARAIRSYEKCGFRVEGRTRETLHREGRRWDVIFMGILQEEWQALNA
jgi:RimJ/RimL family protein N-acetyltransferase